MFATYYDKVRPTDSPAVGELLEQIDDEFADFAPVLRMNVPEKSLAESFSETHAVAE